MGNQASSGELKQIIDLLEPQLTHDHAKGVIENGDLLKMFIGAGPSLTNVDRKKFREALNVLINPYASEVTESNYGYPAAYKSRNMAGQVETLQKIYKDFHLDASHVVSVAASIKLPEGAELLQVVPKLSVIAKAKGIRDPYGDGYGKSLELMLAAISASGRAFKNYREGALTKKHVRLLASTRKVLIKLERETPGDFLVIPIQSGLLYRGSSVRRSVWEIEHSSNQWALPSWVIGHHLLTHPERLTSNGDLFIDCAGDEYSPDADGGFTCYLCFSFGHGQLKFSYDWVGDVYEQWGAGSGFLPECPIS